MNEWVVSEWYLYIFLWFFGLVILQSSLVFFCQLHYNKNTLVSMVQFCVFYPLNNIYIDISFKAFV